MGSWMTNDSTYRGLLPYLSTKNNYLGADLIGVGGYVIGNIDSRRSAAQVPRSLGKRFDK